MIEVKNLVKRYGKNVDYGENATSLSKDKEDLDGNGGFHRSVKLANFKKINYNNRGDSVTGISSIFLCQR